MRREFELSPHQEIKIADLFPGIITPCIVRFERIEGDLHIKAYRYHGGHNSVGIPSTSGEIVLHDKSQFFMSHGGCNVICIYD